MVFFPSSHQALVLTARGQPLTVEETATPIPLSGQAIIRITSAPIVSYAEDVVSGKRLYPFPTPIVPGGSAIGRVVRLGPDSTKLQHNDLVFIEGTIRSRDGPGDIILLGIAHGATAGSKKLMEFEWRDGVWAEYAKVPLENVYKLDEEKLQGFRYSLDTLTNIGSLCVPHGGLSDIGIRAGETIIITPTTGQFGSAAVRVAIAMGAKVVALGRNGNALAKLQSYYPPGRLITIPITEDSQKDAAEIAKYGPYDAYLDISPAEASGCHYVKTCILSLRHGGRVSLMGGFRQDVPLPYNYIMRNNITLKGTWMSSPEQNRQLIKMVEQGLIGLGVDNGWELQGKYKLEDWQKALAAAKANNKPGQYVVFAPWLEKDAPL